MENWIFSKVVEKYLSKTLATVVVPVKLTLLSMMEWGDVWSELFSEVMFFIPFHVFSRSLIFSWKKLVK